MVSQIHGKTQIEVFQDRELRKIFGPKDYIIWEWRNLHDQELLGSQFLSNIIWVMGGACGKYVRKEKKHTRFCWRRVEGKRSFARPWFEGYITMTF
jgi:hypothetical protein